MKISLILFLLLSMVTLFQGCGGGDSSKPQTETNTQVKGDGEHVSTAGNYVTTVDNSSGENVYSNNFTTQGYIKVDNRFNYLYELAYTDEAQYILFTRDDIRYQMGFILRDSKIQGGDSYGILANFIMNDSYDVLESMQLRNNDGNPHYVLA